MTTTLITGANKGLGLQTARRLIAAGHTVFLGARDAERGQAAADEVGARLLLIDVTDEESVEAAAAVLREEVGSLDVLVNNAGIAGGQISPADTTGSDVQQVFDTNVFGVVRVMHAFLPLLAAVDGVVVNVSSGLGSLALTSDPDRFESSIAGLAYNSSKSAVNMLTSQYAKAYPNLRINAADPGYTATDLNGHNGTQTLDEGAEIIVRLAMLGADGPTGGYFNTAGTVPW